MVAQAEPKVGLIYGLIPKIMLDIGAIGKGRKNQQQNYSFRGIDDVYNAIQRPLSESGVFVVPEVVDQKREERETKSGGILTYTILTVKHTFYGPDGSHFSAVTVGEAMDSGDKSSNKAMSAAMKYALIEVFCIPTEDDNDTENQTHEVTPKTQAKPAPQDRIQHLLNTLKRVESTKAQEVYERMLERAGVEKVEQVSAELVEKAIGYAESLVNGQKAR